MEDQKFGNLWEGQKPLLHSNRSEVLLIFCTSAGISSVNTYFSTIKFLHDINPYPTAFPYGNGMVLHFYQQQESSTTKTVHKVINKGLKAYV